MPPGVLDKKKTGNLPADGERMEVYLNTETNFEQVPNNQAQLGELRKILIQPEEVGDVLPAAITKRAARNDELVEAVLPLTEDSIRTSVERDPQVLSTSLAPIIGPAIVKAIALALEKSSQSLNQTLEQSLSPKSFRWRLEAMRTGKSFAEIVMLRTLLYRVEQIFLIHKRTGLLLQHVSAETADAQDGEMISAMLTAIQDFVHDSFQVAENATLDSLKIKELSVWIEHRRDAVLAVVIRGNAPLELREMFAQTIERIQFDREQELEDFKGETTHFDTSRPVLQECLKHQIGEAENKKSGLFSPLSVLTGILTVLLLVCGFLYIRDYLNWSNYIERLKNENGIVVTEQNRGWVKHEVEGLRDELAIDPKEVLGEYGYEADDVVSRWKNYQDLSPAIVLERTKRILKPPPNVNLTLENGILTVHGEATNQWLLEARQISQGIAGIDYFRVERD